MVTERVKKGKWEGKREDVIRQANGTDSCFATHLFSKSLHQFFAEEFKGSLKLRRAPYLLRSSPKPPRQFLLARTPTHLVFQFQLSKELYMFSPVSSL